MSYCNYESETPNWSLMIMALNNNGMRYAEIARQIGSTPPHVTMIANGTRGENLSYKTGFRLAKLFESECVKKENQHGQ